MITAISQSSRCTSIPCFAIQRCCLLCLLNDNGAQRVKNMLKTRTGTHVPRSIWNIRLLGYQSIKNKGASVSSARGSLLLGVMLCHGGRFTGESCATNSLVRLTKCQRWFWVYHTNVHSWMHAYIYSLIPYRQLCATKKGTQSELFLPMLWVNWSLSNVFWNTP